MDISQVIHVFASMRFPDQQAILQRLDTILPSPRFGFVTGLSIAAASVAVAVVLRQLIDPWLQAAQFVTFFPAVVLTALLGGTTFGLIAVALSAISWWAFFGPSVEATEASRGDLIGLILFLIVSTILAIAVGVMRSALSATRALQETLEVRVQERTKELENAQTELRNLAAELEDLVDRRTREVEQSRDLLGSVIEGLPDAVFLMEGQNNDLRFIYVNAAGESLLERKRSDIIGKSDREIIHRLHALENREVLESQQPLLVRDRSLESSDGSKSVEVRKFPLGESADGKTTLLTIIRDMTEMRKMEQSLRQTQRLDSLGQLTGGVAHDFNNLLAIAIGNLDLLDELVSLAPDAQELLDSARNACLGGAELTARLLAFARKQTLQPVPTDINDLISEYSKLLRRLLGAHIDLRLDLAEGLWQATVDRGQLEAAITNLATNARDAMPQGGRMAISTRNDMLDDNYVRNHPGLMAGEYIAVEVTDSGSGMTPEVQAKAVEPFFTTKEEGKGTGLGLSMVFGFAKQSGGHVRIYSEFGQGTTVTLLLPRAEDAAVSEAVAQTQTIPRAKSGELILVVDDNAALLRVAVSQLKALGYEVLQAGDGPSALELIKENPQIKLLLTDIIMPGGLSGVDLGYEAQRMLPHLRLMYMSGFPEAAFGDEARLDPHVILVRKPFRQTELAHRVREAFER